MSKERKNSDRSSKDSHPIRAKLSKATGGSSKTTTPVMSAKKMKRKTSIHHDLRDIEDDFEEFESPQADSEGSAKRGPDEGVTIWMNSWMDEDDSDFASVYCSQVKK